MRVPFNRTSLVGRELEYVSQAVTNGHISGDGYFSKRCHSLLEELLGVPKVFLTTSCTHALEMTALLLDLQPGDEVIIPSFTFVSTVNAFVLRGARPVFIDVRPDTLNLDQSKIERLITKRTKAIVVMHYGGVGCEMDVVMDLAKSAGIQVIEDTAHGLFGRYKGRNLGTFGTLGALSFHETKNFSCGEGGALLINDPSHIERAEIIREKGTDRGRFFRGQVDKYTWIDVGSSYLPSDMLAAFLFGQLEARENIQKKRCRIWNTYYEHLAGWAKSGGVTLPTVPEYCEQAYHLFYMLMSSLSQREALIDHLKIRGILGIFHYLPLHLSPVGRRMGYREGDCPVTEEISERLIRLPFFYSMTGDDQKDVIDAILKFS